MRISAGAPARSSLACSGVTDVSTYWLLTSASLKRTLPCSTRSPGETWLSSTRASTGATTSNSATSFSSSATLARAEAASCSAFFTASSAWRSAAARRSSARARFERAGASGSLGLVELEPGNAAQGKELLHHGDLGLGLARASLAAAKSSLALATSCSSFSRA